MIFESGGGEAIRPLSDQKILECCIDHIVIKSFGCDRYLQEFLVCPTSIYDTIVGVDFVKLRKYGAWFSDYHGLRVVQGILVFCLVFSMAWFRCLQAINVAERSVSHTTESTHRKRTTSPALDSVFAVGTEPCT